MPHPALGLIETNGFAGALAAVRAASTASQVVIISTERGKGGGMVVKIEGEVGGVQTSLEAGAQAAEKTGQLLAMHMIPQTDKDSGALLPYHQFLRRYNKTGAPAKQTPPTKPAPPRAQPARPATRPPQSPKPRPVTSKPPKPTPAKKVEPMTGEPLGWAEIEAMPVVKLRKYARTVSALPIQGREISRANKEVLLEAFRSIGSDRI